MSVLWKIWNYDVSRIESNILVMYPCEFELDGMRHAFHIHLEGIWISVI